MAFEHSKGMSVDGQEMKQIQAGIWLPHTKKHYGTEITIQSCSIGCEIGLCEYQYIEVYITFVWLIIHSNLCYHLLVTKWMEKELPCSLH